MSLKLAEQLRGLRRRRREREGRKERPSRARVAICEFISRCSDDNDEEETRKVRASRSAAESAASDALFDERLSRGAAAGAETAATINGEVICSTKMHSFRTRGSTNFVSNAPRNNTRNVVCIFGKVCCRLHGSTIPRSSDRWVLLANDYNIISGDQQWE